MECWTADWRSGLWAVGRVMCWFFSFLSCTCCTTTKKSTRPKGQSSRSRSRHLQEQLGIIPHRGGEEEPRRVVRWNRSGMAREKSKRAGWLCMPHPSSIDGCCMAIKTYGRHNFWKTIGLARSGRPSSHKKNIIENTIRAKFSAVPPWFNFAVQLGYSLKFSLNARRHSMLKFNSPGYKEYRPTPSAPEKIRN